jgi:hypothetical protein
MFAHWRNNGIIGGLSILEQLGAMVLGDRYHMGEELRCACEPLFMPAPHVNLT